MLPLDRVGKQAGGRGGPQSCSFAPGIIPAVSKAGERQCSLLGGAQASTNRGRQGRRDLLTELFEGVLATGNPTCRSVQGKAGVDGRKKNIKKDPLKLFAGRRVAGFFGSCGLKPTEARQRHACGVSSGRLFRGCGLADTELSESDEFPVIRNI